MGYPTDLVIGSYTAGPGHPGPVQAGGLYADLWKRLAQTHPNNAREGVVARVSGWMT